MAANALKRHSISRASQLARKVGLAAAVALAAVALGQAVPAGTDADIRERTRPFGNLCVQGDDCGGTETPAPAPAASGMTGEDVYSTFCHTCHGTGLNDAPKIGDAESWASRLSKGAEELLRTTKEGLNLMPVMGLCMSCSDEELQAAIDYMLPPAE